nr:uncharacterized protein LOC105339266 [Crassostrea gigas]
MSDMSNGMPLRVIRRVEKTVWCIPVTHFSEDVNRRKRVKDESRSRQIDEMCSEIVEELNSSKFTTNYFLYNGTFWCRVGVFSSVWGSCSFSVAASDFSCFCQRYNRRYTSQRFCDTCNCSHRRCVYPSVLLLSQKCTKERNFTL